MRDAEALAGLDAETVAALSDADLLALAQDVIALQAQDRHVNQLRYYHPVSAKAVQIHTSQAKILGIGGGNGSSKTDSALVELVIRATGQIPLALEATYPREKLRGPINCRVVVESITNTLDTIILPKLQWWQDRKSVV